MKVTCPRCHRRAVRTRSCRGLRPALQGAAVQPSLVTSVHGTRHALCMQLSSFTMPIEHAHMSPNEIRLGQA